jgi:HEAT repeat protein
MSIRQTILLLGIGGILTVSMTGCKDPSDQVKSSDSSVVVNGLHGLAIRGTDEDIQTIQKVAEGGDPILAAEAVRSLGLSSNRKAGEVLRGLASNDQRAAIRVEAVVQLPCVEKAESLDTLRKILTHDPDPNVRMTAIAGIEALRSFADITKDRRDGILLQMAEKDPDPAVRARAAQAIQNIMGVHFDRDAKGQPVDTPTIIAKFRAAMNAGFKPPATD